MKTTHWKPPLCQSKPYFYCLIMLLFQLNMYKTRCFYFVIKINVTCSNTFSEHSSLRDSVWHIWSYSCCFIVLTAYSCCSSILLQGWIFSSKLCFRRKQQAKFLFYLWLMMGVAWLTLKWWEWSHLVINDQMNIAMIRLGGLELDLT